MVHNYRFLDTQGTPNSFIVSKVGVNWSDFLIFIRTVFSDLNLNSSKDILKGILLDS